MESETEHNHFLDKLAFGLSALTSPYVVIPVMSLWVVGEHGADWHEGLLWAGITVFFTTIVPLLFVWVGIRRGAITDIHVMVREERLGPFIVATISSFVGTLILHRIGAPMEIVVLGAVVVANGLVFAIMSCFTKVSIHMAVVTVGIYISGVLSDPAWYALIATLPFVLWGRVYRKRHSIREGIIAVLIACLITAVVLILFGFNPTGLRR